MGPSFVPLGVEISEYSFLFRAWGGGGVRGYVGGVFKGMGDTLRAACAVHRGGEL